MNQFFDVSKCAPLAESSRRRLFKSKLRIERWELIIISAAMASDSIIHQTSAMQQFHALLNAIWMLLKFHFLAPL
jgi:hypothetical protein